MADGVPLEGALAVRARQQTRSSTIHGIAGELEEALSAGLQPACARGARHVDLSRDAIVFARAALEALIERLRAPGPVNPRGVALGRRLVRDAESPLYSPGTDDDLLSAVQAARRRLDAPRV